MNKVYHLYSPYGDEYKLCLSSEDGQSLAVEARERFGLDIISIELVRIHGKGFTSNRPRNTGVVYFPSCAKDILAHMEFTTSVKSLSKWMDWMSPISST